MARLRRDTAPSSSSRPSIVEDRRQLRIVASGTCFLTHTLEVPSLPEPSTATRAKSVRTTRGGSATCILSLLAQFPSVEAVLVAALGQATEEGRAILRDLRKQGVITKYAKIHDSGVPSAWVINAGDEKSVINHNPLPDLQHEEFVSILGPLLAPENYDVPLVPAQGPFPPLYKPTSPAPFDWLHFEGRSVKTTLSNITGIDGMARERHWRSHCVFSVDCGRKGRQGVEALIPHADVIFFSKAYAPMEYQSTPRAFLLSLTSIAPPHALLVAQWGDEGAALLSVPTREYFQSSNWVEEPMTPAAASSLHPPERPELDGQSVRSGSEYWADGRAHTPSSSAFTAFGRPDSSSFGMSSPDMGSRSPFGGRRREDDTFSDAGTEVPAQAEIKEVDPVGGHDAFVAGMIWALSRRICPGAPYTPSAGADPEATQDKGKWRLDECLRFATELSGRKARKTNWEGLAQEMSGW